MDSMVAIGIAPLVLAGALAASSPGGGDYAFVTLESGTIVGVSWVERRPNELHSRSVLMQSSVIDARIERAEDGTAFRASTRLEMAGSEPHAPIERTAPPGAIFWSDMSPVSIEEAVLRARALGGGDVKVPATSLFRDSRDEISVARLDSTDWVVACHGKRYDVLTDRDGRMLSASLPEFGVVIERRASVPPKQYPLWPPYAGPPDSAYRAVDVSIPAPGGHVLAGTLTRPRGRGPFPAVVLITGLSPNNRNEGQPPWMPLRDLADALTRRGLAVLRVDDRGVGASTGDRASSTTLDEAADVHVEVAWLRTQHYVDARRVGLLGYSEGGLIAPIVASEDSKIAAIVTLDGPGVSGPEVARYQTEAAVVRDPSIAPGDREAAIQKLLADTLTVRETSYLSIDPLSYARRTRCPALILHGANDLHVPSRSAERIAWAMRDGGNRDVTVRLIPGVSHSLLYDPVGLASGWVYLPGFLTAPEVSRSASDWMADRLRARRPGT